MLRVRLAEDCKATEACERQALGEYLEVVAVACLVTIMAADCLLYCTQSCVNVLRRLQGARRYAQDHRGAAIPRLDHALDQCNSQLVVYLKVAEYSGV